MNQLKKDLYQQCLAFVEARIRPAEQAIISAREAAADDTKSSAGDKYETTREMMQQEISRNQMQLMEARKLKHALSQISPDKQHDTVSNGSIVITDQGNFYLAISAGQLKRDTETYFAVSPYSPIGKKLLGLKVGDSFEFNGKGYVVRELG